MVPRPLRCVVNQLRDWIPERYRERYFRAASAVSVVLLAFGSMDQLKALLWGQVAMGGVTALFALLYATAGRRVALYAVVGPLGSLLMAYGVVTNAHWAVITAAVGQLFGITTAAAKTVEAEPRPYVLLKPKAD